MDDFTNPNRRALAQRTDEALIAYVRDAYAAGATAAVQLGWSLLQYRHQDRIRGILAAKLPSDNVDEAAQEVLIAAYEAVVGEHDIARFAGWLNQVTFNLRAEFWRGKPGKSVKVVREGVPLDDDREGSSSYELADDGGFDRSDLELLVDELLARRNSRHREIVRLNVIEGWRAKEVSAKTGETEANVYQVAKRFRDELRAALAGADDDRTQDRT
ncbi:MAG: hypothetical protein QOE86_2055 [Solirubrobacteraceae bacterium]|jgi:DNA-directed RNA polymerase specialized sigma24 family protein|nr:hypothetical protein [Solirubrobacteraceae bacterium]